MRSSQTHDQSGGERQQFEQGVHRDGFRAEFSLSFPKLNGFAFQVKKFVKQKKNWTLYVRRGFAPFSLWCVAVYGLFSTTGFLDMTFSYGFTT